jgi:hypothetical protein
MNENAKSVKKSKIFLKLKTLDYLLYQPIWRRHDIQQSDIQLNTTYAVTLSCTVNKMSHYSECNSAKCHFAECRCAVA